jgi:hypothetical protein
MYNLIDITSVCKVMFLSLIKMKIRMEARENLNPAEKIGVSDSSPNRIAIQVEPQIKHSNA